MNADRLVLGVHMFAHGFGWILFERASVPLDWGVVERKHDRNAQCLFAVERILERYHPEVLALESYTGTAPARANRVRQLCRRMVSLAKTHRVEVCVYSRGRVQAAFAGANAASRYEIALAVAQRVAAIRPRLPKKRAIWDSEKPNMALFSAAAVALTHYAEARRGNAL